MTKTTLFLALAGTIFTGATYASQAPENPFEWIPSQVFKHTLQENPAARISLGEAVDAFESTYDPQDLCVFEFVDAADSGIELPETHPCKKWLRTMHNIMPRLQDADEDLQVCLGLDGSTPDARTTCKSNFIDTVKAVTRDLKKATKQ